MKTKILPVLLLLIAALPILCTIAYLVKANINAYQMEEKLEQSSLHTILVSTREIVWLEKGKEVLINGKLFDVKSAEVADDKIWLTGLFDTAEDKLIEGINVLEESDDASSPVNSILAQLLCPAILQHVNFLHAEKLISNKIQFPNLLHGSLSKPFIGISTPPPNC